MMKPTSTGLVPSELMDGVVHPVKLVQFEVARRHRQTCKDGAAAWPSAAPLPSAALLRSAALCLLSTRRTSSRWSSFGPTSAGRRAPQSTRDGFASYSAAASLSVAGLTISLAYFSAPAFEVVATLCWYTTWCYMTWLPVSAASSSLSFKRRQKLRLLLIGVAVGATATFLALRYSCPPELALWLPSLASDALALLMVGLVLPLLLVHMRRFEAAILERSLRSVVAQRASVIPSWMPARGKDVIKTSDGAVAADVAWLPPQSTLPEADASRAAFVSKRTSSMDDLFRTSYSDASNDSLFRSSSYSSSLSTEGLVQEGTDPWEEGNEDDEAQKESGIAAADTASQQKVGEKESARTACSSWYADTLRSQMARKTAGANASSLHPPLASTVVDVSARSEITPAPPSQPLRGEPQPEYAPMRISPPAPAALSSGSTPPASSSSPVSSSGPTEHQVSHRAPPQGRREPQEYQSQQQPRRQVPLFNPWASPAAASAPCQATASQARASLQRVAELQVTPPATLDKTHSFVAHLSSSPRPLEASCMSMATDTAGMLSTLQPHPHRPFRLRDSACGCARRARLRAWSTDAHASISARLHSLALGIECRSWGWLVWRASRAFHREGRCRGQDSIRRDTRSPCNRHASLAAPDTATLESAPSARAAAIVLSAYLCGVNLQRNRQSRR